MRNPAPPAVPDRPGRRTGQEHAAKPGDPTVGESFGVNIVLQPGKQITGWVIVDVPEDAKITAVTYQMDAVGAGKERTGTCNLVQHRTS